ncbi:MAG: MarR family winged helix-turn-helix transcriptional regulator [Egibacteraceae bacterium]
MLARGEIEAQTAQAEALTQVILLVFQAKGLLLTAGDALASQEELTSARWQVLGAITLAQAPLTVPQIARRMGLTPQSVHATVKRLAADGLVTLLPNADHRRSRLIRLTERGATRYSALAARQVEWSNRLAEGMELADLETAAHTLSQLCERLESATHDHTS